MVTFAHYFSCTPTHKVKVPHFTVLLHQPTHTKCTCGIAAAYPHTSGTYLNVHQVQLNRVVPVNILIGKEEFFAQPHGIALPDALLAQRLVVVEPVDYMKGRNIGMSGMLFAALYLQHID